MLKERSYISVVLFFLLQLPLIFLFKNRSFEEMKWQIVGSEVLFIGISLCLFLGKRRLSSLPSTSTGQVAEKEVIAKVHPQEELSLVKNECRALQEQKECAVKELSSVKERLPYLEKELSDLKQSYIILVEEKEKLRSSKQDHEENVQLLRELIQKMKKALFTEIEAQQEMRRQHVIEVRALLRKEGVSSHNKEGLLPPERKNLLPFVPRGTQDPALVLLLISAFAEKLKVMHEQDQNAQFLVRRKFFEELKALHSPNLLCLSVEKPGESVVPQPHIQSDDAQKLLEWIRQRLVQTSWQGGESPVSVTFSEKERWLVIRLDKPFFHDLFLCANQSKP